LKAKGQHNLGPFPFQVAWSVRFPPLDSNRRRIAHITFEVFHRHFFTVHLSGCKCYSDAWPKLHLPSFFSVE
jgi:protocatechuate 3,4-dioxygenase beta subunit